MAVGAGPVEFHVSGIAKIYCFSPAKYLGYCSEAGVQLEFDPKFLPVHTDAYGDQVPEDVQNMGMLATISFELLKWDQTVLALLQAHSGSLPAGTLGNGPNTATGANDLLIGYLMKQCGWMFPVAIQRTTTGCETNTEPGTGGASQNSYIFGTCYVGMDSFNLGTKNTRHRLTIHAIPNASGQLFTVGSIV